MFRIFYVGNNAMGICVDALGPALRVWSFESHKNFDFHKLESDFVTYSVMYVSLHEVIPHNFVKKRCSF